MAIAFDDFTVSGAPSTADPITFNSPDGTDRAGCVVMVIHRFGSFPIDAVVGVTLDGNPMEEVDDSPLLHGAGSEDGSIHAFFMDAPPDGELEVEVDMGGTGFAHIVLCAMVTADSGHVGVYDVQTMDSASQSNPLLSLSETDGDLLTLGALLSGQDDPANVSVNGTYCTELDEQDFGDGVGSFLRDTTPGDGAGVAGWTAAAEEAGAMAVHLIEADAPVAVTQAATSVSAVSAQLNGTVNPGNVETDYYFEWGETDSYGNSLPVSEDGDAGSGGSAAAVDEALSGLSPETTYHYRLVAENAVGTDEGDDQEFTTAEAPRPIRLRENPPDELSVNVYPPGGGAPIGRWADDEVGIYKPNGENVLAGLKLVDEIPGGEKEASGELARDPRFNWPDLEGFAEVKVMGPGRHTVWGEGRLSKAAKERDEGLSMAPIAVGYQAALDDDRGLIGPGYIDSSQEGWEEPSADRRLELLDGNYQFQGSSEQLQAGEGGSGNAPGLRQYFTRLATSAPPYAVVENWKYGGGAKIEKVRYDVDAGPQGMTDANWVAKMRLTSLADLTGDEDDGTDHDDNPATNQTLEATGNRYYVAAMLAYIASVTADGEWGVNWRNLRLIGEDAANLAEQGTWPDIGFTAKQMLEHAIPLYAPPLTLGQIDDDGFVIPQAWYAEPGPLSEAVAGVTRFGLYDWLVFGKVFSLRAPGTYGRTWLARASDSGFDEEGLDTERLWESILVRYQDVDGSTRTVGPSGSGAHVEDESLQITDPEHPAVKAGITRRDLLDMAQPATSGLAIAVGQRWLEDANELARSGRATLSGYVLDDRGTFRPASHVRGGDRVRFMDLRDNSPRRVMRREYDHDTRSVNVDLDAPPEGIQTLLERLQVNLVRLGLE